jgi:hypothetical protein
MEGGIKMTPWHIRRREILKTFGLSAAAYAFLPKGMMNSLFAQSGPAPLKFFGTIFQGHGGEFGFGMRPVNASNSQIRIPNSTLFTPFTGYNIRGGALTDFTNPDGSLNTVFPAEWQQNALLPYLNLLTGIDSYIYWGHGYHMLGNTNTGHNANTPAPWRTLDHVIHQSPLYRNQEAKFLFFQGGGNGLSVAGTDPNDLASPLMNMSAAFSLTTAYSRLFYELPSTHTNASSDALDQIMVEINGLRLHPRLATEDRAILDAHLTRMAELRMNVLGNTCSAYGVNPFWNQTQFNQNYAYRQQVADYLTSMLVFAVSTCEKPVVFTTNGGDLADRYNQFGDFHENVAHFVSNRNNYTDPQRITRLNEAMLPWNRDVIHNLFFALSKKLKDTPVAGGGNLLDQSLLMFLPECGAETHQSFNLSIATAGKAAGRWRSGYYVHALDARTTRRDFGNRVDDPLQQNYRHLGLPFINVLNTVCEAAGLTTSDYELQAGNGFGRYQFVESGREAGQRPAIPFNGKLNWLLSG